MKEYADYIRTIVAWVLLQDDIAEFAVRFHPVRFGTPAIQVILRFPTAISQECSVSYVWSILQLEHAGEVDAVMVRTLETLADEARTHRPKSNFKASPFS
jgi:hypothetical protein